MSGRCLASDLAMLHHPGSQGQQALGCRLRYWAADVSVAPSCVRLP